MKPGISDNPVKPYLIRRNGGDWLAIAPKTATFSIGVTAATAEEAASKFGSVYNLWLSLLKQERLDVPKTV